MYGIYREKPFAESLFEITGCRPEDITIVINTHLHFDHAGGNTAGAVVGPLSRRGEPKGPHHRQTRNAIPECPISCLVTRT